MNLQNRLLEIGFTGFSLSNETIDVTMHSSPYREIRPGNSFLTAYHMNGSNISMCITEKSDEEVIEALKGISAIISNFKEKRF